MGAWITEDAGDTRVPLPATEHPAEHWAITEAREATRLPRWFWLAAVMVLVLVTLPACGGGGCDEQQAQADPACRPDTQPVDCKSNPEQCT